MTPGETPPLTSVNDGHRDGPCPTISEKSIGFSQWRDPKTGQGCILLAMSSGTQHPSPTMPGPANGGPPQGVWPTGDEGQPLHPYWLRPVPIQVQSSHLGSLPVPGLVTLGETSRNEGTSAPPAAWTQPYVSQPVPIHRLCEELEVPHTSFSDEGCHEATHVKWLERGFHHEVLPVKT